MLRATDRSACDRWLVGSYVATLTLAFLGCAQEGLWEDGYFVKRFAYNLWHHGSFSWNPSDGPVYGMTSQTLQLVGAALFGIAPGYTVLTLKVALSLAALATLLLIGHSIGRQARAAGALIPAVVGLSLPLVLEVAQTGLETTLGMFTVALSLHVALRFREQRSGPLAIAASVWLVYLTRPDAVLIPAVLMLGLMGRDFKRTLTAGALTALGLGLLLLSFRAYYGTALPLPFYVKTEALADRNRLDHALFAAEKIKNATQVLFFMLPFVLVTLWQRSREGLSLLCAAGVFGAYHYFTTVEVMGHLSRFYLPALPPLLMAACLAYPTFLQQRRMALVLIAAALYGLAFRELEVLDITHDVDIMLPGFRFYGFLAACGFMLLTPQRFAFTSAPLIAAVSLAGALVSYPLQPPRFEKDDTILLRQIKKRRVFRGLAQLRKLDVHTLYHTDMGAPGVLFPEARVVDLDGLLNEDITLRHASFDELCVADRPDAIFVPNTGYPSLRKEVLKSPCAEGYQIVAHVRRQPHLLVRPELARNFKVLFRGDARAQRRRAPR